MNLKLRYKIVSVVAVLAGIFVWGRCSRSNTSRPQPAAVLPKDVKERIVIDPVKRKLTIIKPGGETQTITLPDRESTIDLTNRNTVTVTAKQFGLEARPFVGIHGSDKLRLGAGIDVFYFKRLDIGLGVASDLGAFRPIAFGHVTYNVWSNVRLGVAYGTNRYVGGTITVRL